MSIGGYVRPGQSRPPRTIIAEPSYVDPFVRAIEGFCILIGLMYLSKFRQRKFFVLLEVIYGVSDVIILMRPPFSGGPNC